MLKSLHINNYVLIEELDIQFDKGFTVITGETGAGKSVILGALSLVFGQRADSKLIRPNAGKCIIEALFDITSNKNFKIFFEQNELDYDAITCIVRREINNNGKSRSFINDTPVSLNILRELSAMLIDIHSQHENLLLMNHSFQLEVIDAIAETNDLLNRYKNEFKIWTARKAELAALKLENERQKAEMDYLAFQYQQLTDARLSAEEFNEIEEEYQLQSHAAEITSALEKSIILFDDDQKILSLLKENISLTGSIKTYVHDASAWTDRLNTTYIELKDILSEITAFSGKIDYQPQRLEQLKERLNEIYTLQNKFRVATVEELIQLRDNFGLKIQETEEGSERMEELNAEISKLYEHLLGLAGQLTMKRKNACLPVENHVIAQMKLLGVPNIRFEVRIGKKDQLNEDGIDEVKFYFSANKNRDLQAVQEVASGGEISRIMLTIKLLIAGKSDLPTIIFDEIDMGVSGEIAHRMGEIMHEMSKNMQVVAITHLPQIAAKGKQHIKVYKDETGHEARTYMKQLSAADRISEIAQMLSGHTVSEAALANAAELLGN